MELKKGIFFSIDALIGAAILITAVILISNFYIVEKRTSVLDLTSHDLIGVLSNIKVGEVNNPFIQDLIANGNITDVNNSVLIQIGEFWAKGKPELAQNLSAAVISQFGLTFANIGLYLDTELVYIINNTSPSSLHTKKRFISGIEKEKIIHGVISRASVKGSNKYFRSEYVYFGGFVGQGNVSKKFFLANDSIISSASLELDTPSDFTLFVNGDYSGDYFVDPQTDYLIPNSWNISLPYLVNFRPGENNIKIVFGGEDEFIAGGFLKVSHSTNTIGEVGISYITNTSASAKHWIEGVEGFINTYSAFFVPGNLTDLKVFLKFDALANATVFFRVGSTTLYEESISGPTEVTLHNQDIIPLLSANGISYSNLSQTTIPLRIGIGNLTTFVSDADIVLVNDVSGSMEWCTNQTSACCTNGACNSWPPGCPCGNSGSYCGWDSSISHWMSTCTDGDVKRIQALKNASKQFVENVLSNNGPLVGLVSYESSTSSMHTLTNNTTPLLNEIDSYDAKGATCICCGINDAVDMLKQSNTAILIPKNSPNWRYLATDPPQSPSGWTELNFDDSSWSLDSASFGKGYYTQNHGFEPETTLPNYKGYYYFRKKFIISNVSTITDGLLSIASDDGTRVYINGVEVLNKLNSRQYASYWNQENIDIKSALLDGENVITIRLRNRRNTQPGCWWRCNYLDAELSVSYTGNPDTRHKTLIVMSDGQANVECAEQGYTPDLNGDGKPDTAEDDAIQAACDAYSDYGIKVHAVGFGADVDEDTLRNIAQCANGSYYSSSNLDELTTVYTQLADVIIEDSATQVFNVSNIDGILYPDSYIEYNYTTSLKPPQFGRITLSSQSNNFGNNISQGTVTIPSTAELVDMTVVTYSAEKWSDKASVKNSLGTFNAFLLSDFSPNYHQVGDPYRVHIPSNLVRYDEPNTVITNIGLDPSNSSGGSPANRIIYQVRVRNSVDYTDIHATAQGCIWHIDFEDGTSSILRIPETYNGSTHCFFINGSYDNNDAYNTAFFNLLSQFDFNDNGKSDVILEEGDIEFDTVDVQNVPSMWGPIIAEVRVWR